MFKTACFAALALACLASNAEARKLHRAAASCIPTDDVMRPCAYRPDFLVGVKSIRVKMHRERRMLPRPRPERVSIVGPSVSGIVAPLAAKVAEIQSACGSRVISGLRHTYIAGTRRMSLHASGKAVDMAGSPGCIYAHLLDWRGGYSVDYSRVRHVHLSYDPDGGREWGLRFVHGRHRYAHRRHRHHRYAGR